MESVSYEKEANAFWLNWYQENMYSNTNKFYVYHVVFFDNARFTLRSQNSHTKNLYIDFTDLKLTN